MGKKKISIILPIFNESQNIPLIHKQLNSIFEQLIQYDYEIIMVDDGSTDDSWKNITLLAHKDSHIKGRRFSRNFGHQIALTAGYDYAVGDAIITLDADMQHPTHAIPLMIEAWEKGNYIVYIRNASRNDGFLKKVSAYFYYLFLDNMSSVKIPRNVQDFRLIDKKVLLVLKNSPEKFKYLRGLVAWTGFSHTFIDMVYDQRQYGSSGYSWGKMFKLAFDGMTGFSMFPLKIACYAGIFVIITGIIMFGYITYDAIINNIRYPLFKWLVTIIYISIGILFILLWFIGEYIGRIYEELKSRPLYITTEEF